MKTKQIRSRILEFFPKDCILELYKICMSKKIRDNNSKVVAVIACLNKYKIDFVELGPGTNRFAILIDGYVFKIALDKWGIQDNVNELTVSEELQPYVAKTYECNDLILVAEYVTVISREEFAKKRDEIEKILAIISEGYLLGDVGIVPKNFCNWGYRDTGELVILDYAYIYRIIGDEMLCSVVVNQDTGERCGGFLSYDNNFHDLYCPRCRSKYTFIDVRRRIPVEHEKHENAVAKQLAYAVTKPVTLITAKEEENPSLNINNNEEESSMPKEKLYVDYDEDYGIDFQEDNALTSEDYLLDALALMRGETEPSVEHEVIDNMVHDIVNEQATKAAGKLVEESNEFDVFTDEIDNIRELRETHTIENDGQEYHETHSTEIVTDEGKITIETETTSLAVDFGLPETDEEAEEITEEVTEAPEKVEAEIVELDSPQQLSLEIPDEDYQADTVTIATVVEEVIETAKDNSEESVPSDMYSFLLSSSQVDDEPINTTMADAFRELGVDIPEDQPIEKVTINETTTSMTVEFAKDEDIDALRNELMSDLTSDLDDDDDHYEEYAEEFNVVERIRRNKSSNNEF